MQPPNSYQYHIIKTLCFAEHYYNYYEIHQEESQCLIFNSIGYYLFLYFKQKFSMPARALKIFWIRKITNTCNATELVQYGNITLVG